MKKFQFILIPFLLLSLMMFISCPQEIKPEIPEDKYSTVSFDSFPDAVKEINIYNGDSCIATLHSNYLRKVFRNLEGELKIDVVYKDLTYSDSKYVGYGTLENDENQFTIFLNNRELINEADFEYTPYYTNPDEELQTNLKLHYTSTFTCTPDLEKLDFTFQNSPKKILKTDVRLRDETIYAYFDFSELSENLVVTLQEKVGDTTYTFTPVTDGGLYYVPKIAPLYLTIRPDENTKMIHYDFKADGNVITDDNSADKMFTYTFYENRTKAQIIKITGPAPIPNWARKVEVANLPEHVTDCGIYAEDLSRVNIFDADDFNLYFSNENDESENKFNISIYYEVISGNNSSEKKYFGNLSTDENPLIVYANGKKVTNTYYQPSDHTEDVSTNAQFRFEGTFESTDDLIRITFENSPRLIATNEVRLLDDSNYIYFDLSEVGKNIDISISDKYGYSTVNALPLEWYGVNTNHIYTMKRTSPFEICFWCSSGYDYPELNTFFINNQSISADLQQVPVNQSYDLMYKYDKNCTPGQMIKIKTGDAVQKTSE